MHIYVFVLYVSLANSKNIDYVYIIALYHIIVYLLIKTSYLTNAFFGSTRFLYPS